MESPIGEKFQYRDITLEVVEAKEERYCVGCYFLNEKTSMLLPKRYYRWFFVVVVIEVISSQ